MKTSQFDHTGLFLQAVYIMREDNPMSFGTCFDIFGKICACLKDRTT